MEALIYQKEMVLKTLCCQLKNNQMPNSCFSTGQIIATQVRTFKSKTWCCKCKYNLVVNLNKDLYCNSNFSNLL